MSTATSEGPARSDARALVDRQISLWSSNLGDSEGLGDWHPDGLLLAPRGIRLTTSELPATINRWHLSFEGLTIEITDLFLSPEEDRLAIEWIWTSTRSADGVRQSVNDAIIVELDQQRIVRWSEYFDTHHSIEFE